MNFIHYSLTPHASLRLKQRGITEENLQLVVNYGKAVHKQNRRFFVLNRKKLPENLKGIDQKKLGNLVIIADLTFDCVLTAYYNDKAGNHVNKKCKYKKKIRNTN